MLDDTKPSMFSFGEEFSDVEPEVLLEIISQLDIKDDDNDLGYKLMNYVFDKLIEMKHPQFLASDKACDCTTQVQCSNHTETV
jgi:hypothetical protein